MLEKIKSIKVMTDYHCFTLWYNDSDEVGEIDPDIINISNELVDALNEWNSIYDLILNRDCPPESGFVSKK
jgi:hypothetical protein